MVITHPLRPRGRHVIFVNDCWFWMFTFVRSFIVAHRWEHLMNMSWHERNLKSFLLRWNSYLDCIAELTSCVQLYLQLFVLSIALSIVHFFHIWLKTFSLTFKFQAASTSFFCWIYTGFFLCSWCSFINYSCSSCLSFLWQAIFNCHLRQFFLRFLDFFCSGYKGGWRWLKSLYGRCWIFLI